MNAAKLDLEIVRGTTFGPVTIVCWANAQKTQRLNLTNWNLEAQARKTPGPGSPVIVDFQPELANAPQGEIRLPVRDVASTLAAPLGSYGWDLVLIRPTGERLPPLVAGKLKIQDIHTQPA